MADNERMRRQLGVSRRDLLRRGAIVGGTLLWTVPVVSTLSRAHPQNVKSPAFFCCECSRPRDESADPFFCAPSTVDNPSDCAHACHDAGYRNQRFHVSPSFIACSPTTGCADHTN
jgi:hypothetical protein